MRYLSPFGVVTGCDLAALALQFCRKRSLERLSQATVASLPFREQEFDLVTSLDVLYHQAVLDRDRAMLEFNRVLRPGGRLFLRLPAYDWLRRSHDRAVHTAHRFTAGEVRKALRAAGFDVEKLSYANTLLFPLALVERLLETTLSLEPERSDLQSSPTWGHRFLAKMLYAEAGWLRAHSLPWGLSVLAVGRKGLATGASKDSG
jgi:SAM-dependent methyltransferase